MTEGMIAIRPNTITVAQIKKHMSAIESITGNPPRVFISGIMFAGKDTVFLTSGPAMIEGFSGHRFIAKIDGETTKLSIGHVDKIVYEIVQ